MISKLACEFLQLGAFQQYGLPHTMSELITLETENYRAKTGKEIKAGILLWQ